MLSRNLEYQITARDRTASAFNSAKRGAQSLEDRVNGIASTGLRLQRIFGAITLGVGAGSSIRELQTLEQQLIRIRGISTNFARDQEFLVNTSRELGLNYRDFANTFSELQALESISLLDPGQAQALSVGFEQAAAKFGTSSADISLAVRGLRQSLTQGTVRAQEFDQIFDAIGAAQPLIAKQLGITTQEFQKLRTANSLVSKDLVNALIPALNSLDGAAQLRAESILGSFNSIATEYQQTLLAFQEPVSFGISNIADSAIIPALQAIGQNSELISASIATVGVGLAAAYGGRAVQRLTTFAAGQAQVTRTSLAHSQALVQNNRLTAQKALADRNAAQSTLAALTSQRQQLAAYISSNQALRANVSLSQQITALRAQEAAQIALIRNSTTQLNTATRNLAASTGLAATASRGFAAGVRGINTAMSLVGGPIGAATIALGLFYNEWRKSTQAIREIRDLNEDLSTRTGINAQERLEAIRQIEQAEREISTLLARRASIISGEISGFERMNPLAGGFIGTVNMEVQSLDFSISQLRGEISELNNQQVNLGYVESLNQELAAVTNIREGVRDLNAEQDRAESILDKLLPNARKISDLKDLRTELEGISGSISSTQYNEANAAITEQINKLSGLTEAREKASQALERNLEEVAKIEESLFTERQRIQAEFDNTEANILRLQVELGDERLSDERVASLVSQARERLEIELDEYNSRLITEEQRRIDEVTRVRLDKLRERFDLEAQLREAQNPTDSLNSVNLINERFALEQDALRKQFAEKLNSEKEYQIASINLERDRLNEIDRLQQEQRERANAFIDGGLSITSSIFKAFERDVGSYVALNETMSAADRQRAEESNRINQRLFDQNKRAQRSQAILEGLGAVAKAFNLPPPFSYISAAAAAAAAGATVSRINRTTFGSGGSVAFSGSGTTSNSGTSDSGLQDALAQNSGGSGTTVYFVTQVPPGLEGAINNDWLRQNQQQNFRKMVQDDIVTVDSNTQIIVADTTTNESLVNL